MGEVPEIFGICDFSEKWSADADLEVLRRNSYGNSIKEGPFFATMITGDSGEVSSASRGSTLAIVKGELYRPRIAMRRWCPEVPESEASYSNVVVNAYEQAGVQGICGLDGILSAIVWDGRRGRLVIYRDASCGQFLYYSCPLPQVLVFATEVEQLFELGGIPRRLSRRSLHEYLRFLDISTPNTVYENVYSAEPGVPLSFEAEGLRLEPQAPPLPLPSDGLTLEAAARELDATLGESLADRLDRSASTGFFLSGGIDSSLLLSLGAALASERVEAFTVGFEQKTYDEMAVASGIAAHLGVRHHKIRFSMREYAGAIRRFLAAVDQPFADPAGLPTFLAMEVCRNSVGVMVDGTGADTLVGVMPARHARLATEYGALLPRFVRRVLSSAVGRVPRLAGYRALVDFEEPEEVLIRWKGWPRAEIERLCGEPVSLAHTRFYGLYGTYGRNEHFERYSALMGNLPDDRVHQGARAIGLKVRFPFWDPRVVSLIRGLPLNFRHATGESKPILRAALARRVPGTLWNIPKHGFDFPFREFMEMDDYRLVGEFLDTSEVLREGIFDPALVRGCVDDFKKGDRTKAFRVWCLLVFRGWYAEHFPRG